ncbi:MAG TPA: gamma carbonic anhydrase family protein [Deltaproteobacteria bacterium]|nr:gamma carbonic anhydrase family protein [Deltaproteobacteria bacterium]
MVRDYRGITPRIGKNVFIAPGAVVLGDVEIGEGTSIWYGTVIRGDRSPIRIGNHSNIQDNCTLHADPSSPLTIGDRSSIGHNAVLHGCTIEDDCLVGISAVVLNDARILKGSIVASGSIVREGQVVGPYHLVAGVPASFKKEVTRAMVRENQEIARTYQDLARQHEGTGGDEES